jgi:predicted regulator of Ras-like GTPase activity (Roadblock/LC7/MglB family)
MPEPVVPVPSGWRSPVHDALAALEARVDDIHGVVLASGDGLTVAATFRSDEADRVAAMAASVAGLAEQILPGRTPSGHRPMASPSTVIRGSRGCLVVQAVAGGVVAARTGSGANLGLVQLELPATVEHLRSLLPERTS